jgi:hypothetical protein
MMTPEKATMAEMAGAKRDRHSDNTDNLSPCLANTRETKLSCWDGNAANGKGDVKETMEDDHNREIDADDQQMSTEKEEIINIDADDDLTKAGGLEEGQDNEDEERTLGTKMPLVFVQSMAIFVPDCILCSQCVQ